MSSTADKPEQRSLVRTILNRVILAVIAVLVLVTAFVLPRIYEDKYEPETDATGEQIEPAPTFTPQQEALYVNETVTTAPYPGDVVAGKDGYYFLGDNQNLNFSQAVGRRAYTPSEIEQQAGAMKAQQDYLADKGIPVAYVVSPAKWSVYDDKMPTWTDKLPKTHILDQLLEAYPELPVVDTREALQDARSTADTYSPMNSHWTQYGAYVGFGELAKWIGKNAPEIGDLPVPQVSGVETIDYNNELDPLFGIPGENPWTVPSYTEPLASYQLTSGGKTVTAKPGTEIDLTQMPATTTNAQAPVQKRVLIMSDSTAKGLSPLLAATFSETLSVRHWMDDPEQGPSVPQLIEDFDPDLVIYTITERHLNMPVTDGPVWDGATRFADSDRTLAQWPDADSSACSGEPSLNRSFTCRVDAGKSVVLQVKTSSQQPGSIKLRAGEHSVVLHIGAGDSISYAVLPSQIAKNDIEMTAITPKLAANITDVEIRAVT